MQASKVVDGLAAKPDDAPESSTVNRSVAVVIACFDMQRFDLTVEAAQSVLEQDYPHQLTIVVDHNEALYWRLLEAVPDKVTVLQNNRSRGASGARNTAALMSECDLIAFLDDDAAAYAGWLRSLVTAMGQPDTIGAGGRLIPRWQEGCPRWFPPEFGWIVGMSMHSGTAPFAVRNVWSGSMMVDGPAFRAVGGFNEALCKVGTVGQPEDTELCLRMSHFAGASGQWLMVPSAVAEHFVPVHRTTLRYFMSTCWSQGGGKVRMRAMSADRRLALSDEKKYLGKTIPLAVGAGVLESLRSRRPDGLLRSGAMLLGIGAAASGGISAELRRRSWRQQRS